MSKMAELEIEILDMLSEGETPVYISRVLDVPVTWVYEAMESDPDKSNTEVFSPFDTFNS